MRDAAGQLSAAVDEPIGDIAGRLVSAVRDLREPEGKPMSQRGMLGLMRALQAEPQRESLDRMLALGTLLEGHADHVMDAVGPSVVPSVVRIRRAFDSRRRRSSNPIHRVVRILLGMDAKIAQYVHGKKFVDAVVAKVGMAQFNAVWSGPDDSADARRDRQARRLDRAGAGLTVVAALATLASRDSRDPRDPPGSARMARRVRRDHRRRRALRWC